MLLCGVRELRYRIHARSESAPITGGSAFNIKAESLRLGDFAAAEVAALLAEYQAETGQAFTPDALARVWELTLGQPWLVNALAYESCFRMPEGRDRTRPIDVALIDQAKENLILRRVTHLDQLADKLREPRVRHIIDEIAPHLVLMAFRHRVINGNGTLEREYASGRQRMDLCLRYGGLTLGIEFKVRRDGAPDPLPEGLVQLDGYLAGLGLNTGWLIIFDRRAGIAPVAERLSEGTGLSPGGRRVRVLRL